MTVVLSEQLRAILPPGDPFDVLASLPGETFREHKHRRTFRTVLDGRACFVKIHGHTSWREILKNALRGRWPVLTARTEWDALLRLRELGVPSIAAMGCGVRGRFPARLESFIVTEALEGMIHLDELPARTATCSVRRKFQLKRIVIDRLAGIARTLHADGLNHRDFYLCHFMLRDRDWAKWTPQDEITLHVIDLHRMQRRRPPAPSRWAIKDVSGLLFSAFDAGVSAADCLRFLRRYLDRPLREHWKASRRWRKTVIRRAVSLHRSERGRSPRLPAFPASSA